MPHKVLLYRHSFNRLIDQFKNHFRFKFECQQRRNAHRNWTGHTSTQSRFQTVTHNPTNKKEASAHGRRHIKVSVGQAVSLKQDVPLFLASM